MALTRATLITRMLSWVQDDAGKITHTDPGDFGTAIDRAVERYSHDRPLEVLATASGDASTYEFALPTGWIEGFSRLARVEHPFPPATGQREPNVIFDADAPNEPEEVRVVQATSAAKKIRFMTVTPETGTNNILFAFTGLHTVHASVSATTTVLSSDEEAFGILASSLACEMVSSKYAETKDAALSVDSVDFRSKSAEYSKRARELLKLYLVHIGGDSDAEIPGASAVIDWDATMSSGRDRIFRRAGLV